MRQEKMKSLRENTKKGVLCTVKNLIEWVIVWCARGIHFFFPFSLSILAILSDKNELQKKRRTQPANKPNSYRIYRFVFIVCECFFYFFSLSLYFVVFLFLFIVFCCSFFFQFYSFHFISFPSHLSIVRILNESSSYLRLLLFHLCILRHCISLDFFLTSYHRLMLIVYV